MQGCEIGVVIASDIGWNFYNASPRWRPPWMAEVRKTQERFFKKQRSSAARYQSHAA